MTVEDRARRAAADIHAAVETVERSPQAGERSLPERFVRFRARKERNRRVGALAFAVAVLAAIAVTAITMGWGADGLTPADTGMLPAPPLIGTLTITSAGCTLDAATDPGVGPFTLRVVNETDDAKSVVVFKISSDARFARMLAFVERVRPRFGNPAHRPGHASQDERLVQSRFFEYASATGTDVDARGSLIIPGGFDPGTYGIECVGRAPEHDSPSHFIGPIDVGNG